MVKRPFKTGWFLLIAVVLVAGTCPAAEPSGPPPIPKLKELHLQTEIVRDGQARASIVAPASGCYERVAQEIAQATKTLTGADLPVVSEKSPAAALPLTGNLIVLGNRSTNPLIADLYNRCYTLLDLRYPGGDGHVVRTLHNPFGNGFNVVFVGGSSPAGVEKATQVFLDKLKGAHQGKSIRLGWLAEIALGAGTRLPKGVDKDAETWEASAGYGSVGYFGWNSLSKRMALYHVTGDPLHAREFLRLAFPDAQARQEICEIDEERIEDKDHPLSGPYHYNAHLMILYWDLIEESPVFTDEERLRVTRAFAEQLNHWAAEWVYAARPTPAPKLVGSRHDQWAAISLLCLARYFQTYYPNPIWQRNLESAKLRFSPLHQHAWVAGENDNLFWYNTAIAPILTYMLLSGDRVPLDNGVLATLLRGQEILVSGRAQHWSLNSAAVDFLHKAAYLTQDGRWLGYRDQTGVDVARFRLGQSYWPEEHLKPRAPEDLVGKWSIQRLPKPHWESRGSGLPLGESFYFGSFRSQTDASGDFILLDGFNGASRNPYHTFAILDLRLAGYKLLDGYLNQVITRVDGLMEPKIGMDAALKHCDVVGSTAVAVAEVPGAAYAKWRRTLINRVGRYALIVDELTFRQDSPNAEVSFEWQMDKPAKQLGSGEVFFPAVRERPARQIGRWGQILACDPLKTSGGGVRPTMTWLGPVRAGERRTFFSLLGIQPEAKQPTLRCCRIAPDSAALALPEPALAIVHADGDHRADSLVLAVDHVFALGATKIGGLLTAGSPVDVDWDLKSGALGIVAKAPMEVLLALDSAARPTLDGKPVPVKNRPAEATGMASLALPAGRAVVQGAVPRPQTVADLQKELAGRLEQAQESRTQAVAARQRPGEPDVPGADVKTLAQLSSAIVDLQVAHFDGAPVLAAAEGRNVHLVGLDGQVRQTLTADGPIRNVCWWAAPKLLLAGCADEKVIAFDRSGQRRWVFVSEMDPAVFRAAKQYWFKSAPGHEGIHGLDVGTFIDGREQVFVGSACTLEILDEAGKLVRRMPLFWGKVSTFAVVDGPKGTKNLLAAFKYNGVNTVAIVNSKTLDPDPRGFIAVPPGHTYMDGWSAMNRHHLFYEDLEGSGTRDVISEINGTWNRVCVWSVDGSPKHSANFGPGPGIHERTMRDLDVCDVDRDGKKEIVAATSSGMVVLLDHKCAKRWAVQLASPANVLCCLPPKGQKQARILLGCDDGQLRVLDAQGNLVQRAKLTGRPAVGRRVADAKGNEIVAMGTENGGVLICTP